MGGCNPFAGYGPSSEKIVTRAWAPSKEQAIPKLYCYQTLGEHMCYAKPRVGKEHLLVGQHVLPPNIPKKEPHEKISPLLGLDAETVRKELDLQKPPKQAASITVSP